MWRAILRRATRTHLLPSTHTGRHVHAAPHQIARRGCSPKSLVTRATLPLLEALTPVLLDASPGGEEGARTVRAQAAELPGIKAQGVRRAGRTSEGLGSAHQATGSSGQGPRRPCKPRGRVLTAVASPDS